MKRLIKYYNNIGGEIRKGGGTNPGVEFSDCSTKREILPELVSDAAGSKELLALAKKLGFKTKGRVVTVKSERYGDLKITHAVKLAEPIKVKRWDRIESYQEYLGFVSIPERASELVEPVREPNQPVDADLAYRFVDGNYAFGIDNYGETVGGEQVMVRSDWSYDHVIPLLGYSLESFEKELGITEHGFSDDTDSCSECNLYDSRDDGYSYNFRNVGDYGYLGINCGCYHEHLKNPKNLVDYINNSDKAIELEAAKTLKKKGKLKFIERFIGGWTDGRGGYYAGKPTREGKPVEILEELRKRYPKGRFVFTHDESGQFQTYFSVWRVVGRL